MWTYSGDPSKSAKDLVRFLIGDTDSSDPLLTDLEIAYLLGQYNMVAMNAAIRACETIMTKFARLANETVGSVKIDFSQKSKAYRDMAAALTQRLSVESMTPYAGGISIADKQTNEQNTDRVKPDFTKHMMENELISPWVTQNQQGIGDGSVD